MHRTRTVETCNTIDIVHVFDNPTLIKVCIGLQHFVANKDVYIGMAKHILLAVTSMKTGSPQHQNKYQVQQRTLTLNAF